MQPTVVLTMQPLDAIQPTVVLAMQPMDAIQPTVVLELQPTDAMQPTVVLAMQPPDANRLSVAKMIAPCGFDATVCYRQHVTIGCMATVRHPRTHSGVAKRLFPFRSCVGSARRLIIIGSETRRSAGAGSARDVGLAANLHERRFSCTNDRL